MHLECSLASLDLKHDTCHDLTKPESQKKPQARLGPLAPNDEKKLSSNGDDMYILMQALIHYFCWEGYQHDRVFFGHPIKRPLF